MATMVKISKKPFGKTKEGRNVNLFTLDNGNMQVSATDYGCTITKIKTPDKKGGIDNIVLGFNSVEGYQSKQYLDNCHYFGCIVGRVCNRISKGKFTLNGKQYSLPINNEDRHIHGGIEGFDKKIWMAEPWESENKAGLTFSYLSPDGEEGYPGNLETTVNYYLTLQNELIIEYRAKTDKPTIINLTNHSYFNLTGGAENILNHSLKVSASTYTELNNLMPTGRIIGVEGTPYDFRKEIEIGSRINQLPDGYDINFPLDSPSNETCRFAGRLSEKETGRYVDVLTKQPAVQNY
jgi:aldose 1-epimerase